MSRDGRRSRPETGFDPIDFLERTVSTPSHESVDEMRELLRDTLRAHGLEPTLDEAGNVLASRGADETGTHAVLNTHLDTVPPHVPFGRSERSSAGGGVEGGAVVHGRGACDAKGPLAALLAAFLTADPAGGSITLAVTPDEEVLSTGAHALIERSEGGGANPLITDADAVIVGEPTDLDACTAAKGRYEGAVELVGANAHAAEPESGANAVAALNSVLDAIDRFDDGVDDEGETPAVHPRLGSPTLTPTVVSGGEATNQVPDRCRLTVDRRSVPPETAEAFRDRLLARLREAVPANVEVSFSFTDRPTPFLEAWETDADAPVVDALVEATEGATEVRPFTAATEASYFAAHAPTVVFGPGVLADDEGAVAHAPREYVRVEDVRTAARAVRGAVDRLLAKG